MVVCISHFKGPTIRSPGGGISLADKLYILTRLDSALKILMLVYIEQLLK